MQNSLKTINIFELHHNVKKNNVGGKAYNLHLLYSYKQNVPKAFFLSNTFLNEILRENNLIFEIERVFNNMSKTNIKSTSSFLMEQILNINISQDKQNEIFDFYKKNNLKIVSVRSSAIGEDGEEDAFAGMLDTYLFVSKSELINVIKKCWASLFNPRCLTYRLAKNIKAIPQMSIVIQEMINSKYAGVGFSINPISLKDETIIEICNGVGENLVSGKVTPKRVVLNNKTEQIVLNEITDDDKNLNNLILKLHKSICFLKTQYGCDVDIEWAIDKNQLYILQCRPLTTIKNQTLINSILCKNWEFYVKRPFCWLFETYQQKAMCKKTQEQYLGFGLTKKNYLILNGIEFENSADEEKNLIIFENKYKSNNLFFNNYAKLLFKIADETNKYTQQLSKTNFKQFNSKQLAEYLIQFNNQYIKSIVPTFARPDAILEKLLHKQINDCKLSEYDKTLIINCIASYSSNYPKLQYLESIHSTLNMAKKYANGQSIEQDIKCHLKNFSWLKGPLTKKLQIFTKADCIKDILSLVENNNYQIKINQNKEKDSKERAKENEVFELLKNNKNLLEIYQNVKDFTYLRTRLTEESDKLFYVFRTTLLKHIAKKVGLTDRQIVMMGHDEIYNMLLKKQSSVDFTERNKSYTLINLNGKWSVLFGEKSKKFNNVIVKTLSSKNKNVQNFEQKITGQVATSGCVFGRVKIINSAKDLKNVSFGDIIVSSMTTPEYISAIEKASGFITDEGGITCHAAIISREFNIPCVVGTKIATKVLKDGTNVMLDANSGEIKF